MKTVIIKNISLPYKTDSKEALEIARARYEKCVGKGSVKGAYINRRSVDARKRNDIRFIYSVGIEAEKLPTEGKLSSMDATILEDAAGVPKQEVQA